MVRHIATHELWIQEHVLRGHVELIKVKNVFNSSDLFTKHLDQAAMNEAVSQFCHRYMTGRSPVAPSLNVIGGMDLEKLLLGAMNRMGATGGRHYEEKSTVIFITVPTEQNRRSTDAETLSCPRAEKENYWTWMKRAEALNCPRAE